MRLCIAQALDSSPSPHFWHLHLHLLADFGFSSFLAFFSGGVNGFQFLFVTGAACVFSAFHEGFHYGQGRFGLCNWGNWKVFLFFLCLVTDTPPSVFFTFPASS